MLANQITHIAFLACKTNFLKVFHFRLGIKAISQGPRKKKGGRGGGGGGGGGVEGGLTGALEPWSPNVILLRRLEPSKSFLQSPESQIIAFEHASTPEYSGSLLVDHALVINMKVMKS